MGLIYVIIYVFMKYIKNVKVIVWFMYMIYVWIN